MIQKKTVCKVSKPYYRPENKGSGEGTGKVPTWYSRIAGLDGRRGNIDKGKYGFWYAGNKKQFYGENLKRLNERVSKEDLMIMKGDFNEQFDKEGCYKEITMVKRYLILL